MTRLLMQLSVLVLLALAWLFLANPKRQVVVGAQTERAVHEIVEATQPASTLEDPPLDSNERASLDPTEREVGSGSTAASASDSTAIPKLYRIEGRVLDAVTRESIASCGFDLVQRGNAVRPQQTDEAGRFVTGAIFEPGWVEARPSRHHVGEVAEIQPTRIWIDGARDPRDALRLEILANAAIEIEVSVRLDDGTPAPEPMVVVYLEPGPAVVPEDERSDEPTAVSTWCDKAGELLVRISPSASMDHRLSLLASGAGGVSPVQTLEPPFGPTQLVLVLDRGSSVRVRVVDPRGSPVAGAEVNLIQRVLPSNSFSFTGTTDALGRAEVTELPGSRFDVVVSHKSSRRSATQSCEVARNASAKLEIVLPDATEPPDLNADGDAADAFAPPQSSFRVKQVRRKD